jgi:hypothetical protein
MEERLRTNIDRLQRFLDVEPDLIKQQEIKGMLDEAQAVEAQLRSLHDDTPN